MILNINHDSPLINSDGDDSASDGDRVGVYPASIPGSTDSTSWKNIIYACIYYQDELEG